MAQIMQNTEVVNGSLAQVKAIMTINGVKEIVELYQIRQLTATQNFNNVEANRLGSTSPLYIQRGWTGTGSMSFFYGANTLARMCELYARNHNQVQFDAVVQNNDPNVEGTIGSQIVQLHNIKPESFDFIMIDVDADFLTNDFDFVFEDFTYIDHWDFNQN